VARSLLPQGSAERSSLICLKVSRVGGIEPCAVGRYRSWDWLEIAGYATLVISALAVVMLLAL